MTYAAAADQQKNRSQRRIGFGTSTGHIIAQAAIPGSPGEWIGGMDEKCSFGTAIICPLEGCFPLIWVPVPL